MQVLLATLKDHLGSWITITDANGAVEREQSFDAWGNLRNPETWTGTASQQPMFDRGFTGHEHITAFGLINMNGRCYDPVTSSFLSVDAYVQSPDNSQSFNRYAYCLNNPLRYTDPSGWKPVGGMKSNNPFHDNWSASFSHPAYEPRDFRNPYHLWNLAMNGNLYGPGFAGGASASGGAVSMSDLQGTYGYHAAYQSNSVHNYTFPCTKLQLIRNWQYNPCYRTNSDIREAGITDLTVGVVNYGNGYQKSYYSWAASSKTHTASALDYVGRSKMDYYGMSIQPLEKYGNVEVETRAMKNNVADISLSTPHYLSVPKAVSVVGGQATMVQSAAYLTQKTCQGAEIFGTVGKAAGRISGAISIGTTAVSIYNRYEYFQNGGDNIGVAVVGATDVAFTIAGFFWPWGTIASVVYFSTEMITDDFWGWGKVR